MSFAKLFFSIVLIIIAAAHASAQGCSDAGFCTAGNFHALKEGSATTRLTRKNEVDLSFYYGTHGKSEKFFQPQINWKRFMSTGSFIELRLPLNYAKDNNTGVSTTGVGDIIATYNNKFSLSTKKKINYSIGFRSSFSNAARSDGKSAIAYPMFLQSGLGTTDIIAVINYDVVKYLSVGTGVQLPLIQYNQHKIMLPSLNSFLIGEGYRRKADALLKITGHYQTGKFKINAGLLSIFHLGNDHYNTSGEKYILQDSKGITLNWTTDCTYAFSARWKFNLLYAEPLKTRKNIPDGLARSRIIVPKLSYSF